MIGVLYVGLDVSDVLTLPVAARLGLLSVLCAFVVLLGHDRVLESAGDASRGAIALLGALVNVRNNAHNVSSTGAQIAQGNNDLSLRTEQQATALEETAATMEQLSSTVRQNADNARQANERALQASSVAARGGEVVGRVVQTMKGVDASSRKSPTSSAWSTASPFGPTSWR